MARAIEVDRLLYQDLDDLIDAVRAGNPRIERFDTSVFTGEYITEVNDDYFDRLKAERGEQARKSQAEGVTGIDLHNNA